MNKLVNKFIADGTLKSALALVRYANKHPMAVISLGWEELEYYNQAQSAVNANN